MHLAAMNKYNKVFVTGISGFLGSHIALQLLKKGYKVVGSLRDLKRKDELQYLLLGESKAPAENLTFIKADLNDSESSWSSALEGSDAIIHVASPFPRVLPDNERELIKPAVEGSEKVINAALSLGITRVVLTSSTGAIIYGKDKESRKGTFSESDWTNDQNNEDLTPYFKSKTLAERAAWKLAQENDKLELTTICPGAILGPVLEKDFGTSANIVLKTLDGSAPAIPPIGFDMVDVRSVAELHILALENEASINERFVGSSGYLQFKEVAQILKGAFPDRKVPKFQLPAFAVKLFSNIDKTLKPILIDLNTERKLSNEKAKRILGWKPISTQEAVISCADSLMKQGLI